MHKGRSIQANEEKQYEMLEQGKFPDEVVKQDMTPRDVELGGQIAKLVISGLWALLAVMASISIVIAAVPGSEYGPSAGEAIAVVLMMLAIGLPPFLLSLKNYILKLKKQRHIVR